MKSGLRGSNQSSRATSILGGFQMVLEKRLVWTMLIVGGLTVISNVGMAQTPSPALLVLDRGVPALDGGDKCSLAIIDPRINKIVGRVAVGEGPHEVAVSADGK